ncbi:protein mono-ADP-ribosyltransferase PARP12-like [Anneissia japonica]|uniref:protein mono-ADP-ribosyltransferase PARP12-like n=1 Tax=Anneissia japonica TaxID=1529436 RepID=UPI00142584FB|nr:protein mono-ADP-ribosyltransferase PARP12-like [Anneissia japonica]
MDVIKNRIKEAGDSKNREKREESRLHQPKKKKGKPQKQTLVQGTKTLYKVPLPSSAKLSFNCVTMAQNRYTHDFHRRPWTYNTESYQLEELDSDSQEYNRIKDSFQATLPNGDITKIERVQNRHLRAKFNRQNEYMRRTFNNAEHQLFHGTTRQNAEDICRNNFNIEFSGRRNGAAYGRGAYFASTAGYSDNYATADRWNHKRMFLARVLAGNYTVGESYMRRPPHNYDSCVNDTRNPTIFVISNNDQIYPEYLITYSTYSVMVPSVISHTRPQAAEDIVAGIIIATVAAAACNVM